MIVRERVSARHWMPPWLRHQHVARYEWASQYCRGSSVLDAACANGYGSRMLVDRGAASVAGLDIDAGTLAEGSAKRGSRLCGDVTRLPVKTAAVDVFVSFETVEHVSDDAAFVREARRVTRSGGTFICSTPNRAMTNPGTSIATAPFNRFHLREYTVRELSVLLRDGFDSIEWYGQSFFAASYRSVLHAVGSRAHMAAVRMHQMRKLAGAIVDDASKHWPAPLDGVREPEVLIAVCR